MATGKPQLIGLGIVSKSNEPIYMCDCRALVEDTSSDASLPTTSQDDDVYGFLAASTEQASSLATQHQFLLHAALDQVDELVHTCQNEAGSRQFSGMPVRKTPATVAMGPHYLGVLLDMGEHEWQVHGYVTATNVKILALTSYHPPSTMATMREFFEGIHSLFIAYAMNPFSNFRSDAVQIESKRFDLGVKVAVQKYVDQLPDTDQ